ncbi:MAG: RNA methyltransferase, partial [Candidatus Binataceae bacterium]
MDPIAISAMTFGPYGVGHLGGKTVMLPNVVPGDLVEATIAAEHGDYAIGKVARLLHPGPGRRDPPCPFLPRCGGCDWQHLDYT